MREIKEILLVLVAYVILIVFYIGCFTYIWIDRKHKDLRKSENVNQIPTHLW